MPKPFLLTASILSADFACLGEQIAEAEAAGVDWIHIDVMDGHFVPNLTMGPFIVETCRRITRLPLDVHLMILSPERSIAQYARAGANLIYVHIEGNPHIHRTLQEIHDLGCQAGIVLNPGTPVQAVEAVLPFVDAVLVMTVNPGYSGQKFIPEAGAKIADLRQRLDKVNPAALIAVDGGVTAETLPGLVRDGAGLVIAATAIFKHPNGIPGGIQALRNAAPD